MTDTTAGDNVLPPLTRLSRDLANAAATMTSEEARFLVDSYYLMQENRKRSDNQVRAMTAEPHTVIAWLAEQSDTLEGQIKRALDKYTDAKLVGKWMKSIYGVGPVIAAGLMAHIDINKAPTAGHIWRFAGIDPNMVWGKGEKRPWNASLKTLTWKVGQSFMKFSKQEECLYGHLYRKRKDYENERNDAGRNSDLAISLAPKFKKTTDAYKWLSGFYPFGTIKKLEAVDAEKRPALLKSLMLATPDPKQAMLPPAQIDARARRYAVKLFLSHLQATWWFIEKGELPPKPYVIDHLAHIHLIRPPNAELVPGFVEAMDKGWKASSN